MKKLLITMGDPSGIGPEVTVKLLHQIKEDPNIEIIVIGERWILEDTRTNLGYNLPFREFNSQEMQGIPVISMGVLQPQDFQIGVFSKLTGEAAYQYFTKACEMCIQNQAQGMVTAPISKEALHLAGHKTMGHTDILAQMTGIENVMAIWHPKLVVGHVTDHLPLKKALASITVARIKRVVKLTTEFLRSLGEANPGIALAGVNPHAGEGGILGTEEIEILKPAMLELEREGYPTLGPVSGDTVFYSALKGKYQGVIAMYHDQGFGPMKTLDLDNSVNVTLGLPFVRTSPDHGTAFDLAGKNLAEASSMISAFNLAVRLLQSQD